MSTQTLSRDDRPENDADAVEPNEPEAAPGEGGAPLPPGKGSGGVPFPLALPSDPA